MFRFHKNSVAATVQGEENIFPASCPCLSVAVMMVADGFHMERHPSGAKPPSSPTAVLNSFTQTIR